MTFYEGFSSPVILHLHPGFGFWDLPGGSTSYQSHLRCCTPKATTAWAALTGVPAGFPCHVKLRTAVVRLASTAKLPGFKSKSLQQILSRSIQIQRPTRQSTLNTNKFRRNLDLINSFFLI